VDRRRQAKNERYYGYGQPSFAAYFGGVVSYFKWDKHHDVNEFTYTSPHRVTASHSENDSVQTVTGNHLGSAVAKVADHFTSDSSSNGSGHDDSGSWTGSSSNHTQRDAQIALSYANQKLEAHYTSFAMHYSLKWNQILRRHFA
jgi:hypothetical protein